MAEQIKVAVVGGGIAGLTLAGALQLQSRSIIFDVFESKSSFSERGASVALAPNAIDILRATGFDIDTMLRESKAARSEATEAIAAVGSHRGETLWTLSVGDRSFSVVRTAWLDQLLSILPQERLHANKKLVSINDTEDSRYTLNFTDGTTYQANIVIGCDGIHSKVREIILGIENRQHLDPIFTGYWDARTIIPLNKAIEGLQSSLFDSSSLRQRMLVGDGSYMLLIPHIISKTYFVVAAGVASKDFDKTSWKTDLSREFLESAFQNWEDPLRSTVITSLLSKDSGPGFLFSEWESPPTPTFYRGQLCIIGDAAHSILPWIGQGAALAIEDACLLASLISAANSTSVVSREPTREVTIALQIFDQLSRKRANLAVEYSRNAAKLSVGGFGLDSASISSLGEPTNWWLYFVKLDGEAYLREAVAHFHLQKPSASE